MKELALQAGVSLATVDRVLHRRPGVTAATQRRVQQAWAELERQQQQVGLQGRRFLIDLVMEAPTRFSSMVRGVLEETMRRAHPAVFRVRDHLAETLKAEQWGGVLDAIGRRGSHGVLLKAPDLPEVAAAMKRLKVRGIPVITLVTDVCSGPRTAYVGLDNSCAGQTAAYLMDQWLGPQMVEVLVSTSGHRFHGEGERIESFRAAFAAARANCGVHVLDAGLGLHGPTAMAVERLLVCQPDIQAVYSVGGANAAIHSAFERAGRACRVFIGHDLDDDNIALLQRRQLSAVLHHDLRHDLHTACLMLMQHHGLAPLAMVPTRSNVEVITPFNLPACTSR